MTASAPIAIDVLAGAGEEAVFAAASEQLAECLRAASGTDWPVRARVRKGFAEIAQPAAVIVSLLSELDDSGDTWPASEARVRQTVQTLVESGHAAIFVSTVFRHVPMREGAEPLRERMRRLNRLAVELSHDFGVFVIDIDRAFANTGARALNTDYRLGGSAATAFAAHIIVATLLAAGLDDVVPVDLQEKARDMHLRAQSAIATDAPVTVSSRSLGFETRREEGKRQVFAPHRPGFMPESLTVRGRWRRLRTQMENREIGATVALFILMRALGRGVKSRLWRARP